MTLTFKEKTYMYIEIFQVGNRKYISIKKGEKVKNENHTIHW